MTLTYCFSIHNRNAMRVTAREEEQRRGDEITTRSDLIVAPIDFHILRARSACVSAFEAPGPIDVRQK